MNKCFSLVFCVCCLLCSSAYGIEIAFEEGTSSLIVSDSLGRPLRRISGPSPHPASDQSLDLAKGETVWHLVQEILCTHPYLGTKVYKFTYPEAIEITFSYPIFGGAPLAIIKGLKDFNNGKMGGMCKVGRMEASVQDPEGRSVISCKGKVIQRSVLFEIDPAMAVSSPNALSFFLNQLENASSQRGLHSLHACAPIDVRHPTLCPFPSSLLEEAGFAPTYTTPDLETGEEMKGFSKIIPPAIPSLPSDASKLTFTLCWEEVGDLPPPDLTGGFGFFIRDEDGVPLGGVLGQVNLEGVHTPYVDIKNLWIHEALRGQRYGAKLVSLAEAYGKERGGRIAELGTIEFQAPWLYRKLGYEQVMVYLEFLQTTDGKWNNLYEFRRDL